MKPGIKLSKAWSDEDMVDLHIEVCDGSSFFTNRIYVGHQQLRDTVEGLHIFKDQIHGGIFNLRLGEFGPEYAAGALEARLHFRKQGRIFVQVSAQAGFVCFEGREFASEAKLYLVSEPALFDEFILALRAMSEGNGGHAELGAVST